MLTATLILFFFLLAIVSAIGTSVVRAHGRINSLKAGLAKTRDPLKENVLGNLIDSRDKEIEALEHTITLKNETINTLEGEISKTKFDYSVQVDSCKCRNYLPLLKACEDYISNLDKLCLKGSELLASIRFRLTRAGSAAPLRGEWVEAPEKVDKVCGKKGELEKSMDRYLRSINVLKSVRHNLRVGGQDRKTTEELKERVASCIAEYNKTKPKGMS